MLSVIVPTKAEEYLEKTVNDLLTKAAGDIEILVGFDGEQAAPDFTDKRVRCYTLPLTDGNQMRHVVNRGVELAQGAYLMKVDAHVMMDEGYDQVLIENHAENLVQIPRRYRLDPDRWCFQETDRPPVDYEYLRWDPVRTGEGFHGHKWDERSLARVDIPIDPTLSFQGACWFMSKDWFQQIGILQTEGYGGFYLEPEEIAFQARQHGGDVVVNKKTWYAHAHKPRHYQMNKQERSAYGYAFNFWVHGRRRLFTEIINRFMPIPRWPEDWERYVYG